MSINLNILKDIMGRLTREDAEQMEREMYPLDDLKKEAIRSMRQDNWAVKGKSTKPGTQPKNKQATNKK